MAERFVTLYGMSDALDPVAFERIEQQFLEAFPNPRRAVSNRIAEQIDQEVKAIVDGAHCIALKILDTNREMLEETP